MYTDPIPLQARTEPTASVPTSVDPTLAGAEQAGHARGAQRLRHRPASAAWATRCCPRPTWRAAARARSPRPTPTDPLDTRTAGGRHPAHQGSRQYGLRLRAGALRARGARGGAARQTRSARARRSATPISSRARSWAMRVVEPDGSFKLNIPADTPIAFSVLDAQGRAFQTHTNWIQARPGERRTCDGCHSPRRGGAHQFGHGRQYDTDGLGGRAGDGAPGWRNHGRRRVRALDADVADAAARSGLHRRLGRHDAGGRHGARRRSALRYTGNPSSRRRPGHGRARQRRHQLPGPYPAACGRAAAARAAPTPAPTAMPIRSSWT